MFQRIYNNPILLYSIVLTGSFFWLYLTFQSFKDFITREFVESLSFFLMLLSSTLLIQEIYKKLFKSEKKQIKIEDTQSSQENNNTNYPQFQSFNDNEEVVYEWEEEEEKTEKETISEQKYDSSKEKIEELEAKIKQLEKALSESQKTEKKIEKNQEENEQIDSSKTEEKNTIEEDPFG